MRLAKLTLAFIVACSTPTTVTDVWKDPAYSATPMRKILVFGKTPAETNRRNLEDTLVAALDRRGVQAFPSYRVFQTQTPQREDVHRYLVDEHYDGALFAEFEGVRTRTIVEPRPSFDNYYGSRFQGGFYSSDYNVYTDQFVKVETTLWDPRDGRLVWSVATQTSNPWSSTDAIGSFVDKLVSTMKRERFIP